MATKRILFGSLLLTSQLIMSSCRSVRSNPYADLQGDLSPEEEARYREENEKRNLGSGFDSKTYEHFPPCLKRENIRYAGAQSSDMHLLKDQTAQQIENLVGGGLYAKASLFGLASAKVQGDVSSSLASTDDTASLIYLFDSQGKLAYLGKREFNSFGENLYNEKDWAKFRSRCGNRFVESVRTGGQLFVGVKYHFTSKEQKEKVKLTISASLFWGLIKFSKDWSKEWREMLANVRVSVDAFQFGGDPKKLEDVRATIHQGSCAGDNAERCSEALDKILAYARDDFPKQLGTMEVNFDPKKSPQNVWTETVNYRSEKIWHPGENRLVAVLIPPSDDPSENVLASLKELEGLRKKAQTEMNRGKAFLMGNLNDEKKGRLSAAISDLAGALTVLDKTTSAICKNALKDPNLLGDCSSGVGMLSNKIKNAAESIENVIKS